MSESTQGPPQQEGKKPNKEKPANLVIPPKKPKLTKAERRALQEAQRAAKQAGKGGGKAGGEGKKSKQPPKAPPTSETASTTTAAAADAEQTSKKAAVDDKSIESFSHLPPYRDPTQHPECFSGATLSSGNNSRLHPAVLELGLQYAQGTVRGGNARCRAMLHAFCTVLQDYTPPPDSKDLRHSLDHDVLKPSFTYWTTQCRPHSVSMGNAFTFFKSVVASLDRTMGWDEMQPLLMDSLEAYERERLDYAHQAMFQHVAPKIKKEGDVLLIFGKSEVVLYLLKKLFETKDFRVIVVDSRPLAEGRDMLKDLRKVGIPCCYVLLNALSYVLSDVTKVILGAAALLSDGSVLGRVGTAGVAALMASSQSRAPVLVCCETYKISNRVQLESITGNELGNPKDVLNEELPPNLRVLNLLYDLTPTAFVSGIVTEMGILPPTSVAVLLREMNPQETEAGMQVL